MMKQILLVVMAVSSFAFANSAVANVNFKSPSGNIACTGYHNGDGVDCVIYQTNANGLCGGRAVQLGIWGVVDDMSCNVNVRQWKSKNYQTLQYGKTIKGKDWRCTSKQSGMTCTTNAGFSMHLSRASQHTF